MTRKFEKMVYACSVGQCFTMSGPWENELRPPVWWLGSQYDSQPTDTRTKILGKGKSLRELNICQRDYINPLLPHPRIFFRLSLNLVRITALALAHSQALSPHWHLHTFKPYHQFLQRKPWRHLKTTPMHANQHLASLLRLTTTNSIRHRPLVQPTRCRRIWDQHHQQHHHHHPPISQHQQHNHAYT